MSVRWWAALALGFCVGNAQAAGLGTLRLDSWLGQPLRAEIDFMLAPDEHPADVRFELGSEQHYQRLGLTVPEHPRGLAIELPQPGAANRVVVTSAEPVQELVLDLIVVMRIVGGSSQVRHYPLLFDLPASSPEPAPAVRSAAPSPPAPISKPAAVSQRTTVADQNYRVVRGDTLLGIAARHPVTGLSRWEVAEELFALNPHAFIDGKRDLIRAGSTLSLPAAAGHAPDTQADTDSPAAAAVEATVTRAESLAAEPDQLIVREAPTREQVVQSLGEWLQASDLQITQRNREARRDLAFARAEIETLRQENVGLMERISALEQRVADQQRLLELRATAVPKKTTGAARQAGQASGLVPADSLPPPPPRPVVERWAWVLGLALLAGIFIGGVASMRRDRMRQEELARRLRQPMPDSLRLPENV